MLEMNNYKSTVCNVLFFCTLTLPAAVTGAEIEIPEKYLNSITYNLKDPDSAKFRNVIADEENTVFCGEINAKNSYGAYSGYNKFYAIPQNDGSVASEIISVDQIDYGMAMIMYNGFCKDLVK
jgi:hypothetical protein|tara:strand:+ start:75 stop:443 length:369 start_codon:yes stop_codon:yes gene_type:complete